MGKRRFTVEKIDKRKRFAVKSTIDNCRVGRAAKGENLVTSTKNKRQPFGSLLLYKEYPAFSRGDIYFVLIEVKERL